MQQAGGVLKPGNGCIWSEVPVGHPGGRLVVSSSGLLLLPGTLFLGSLCLEHSSLMSLIKRHLPRKAVLESSLQSVLSIGSAHTFPVERPAQPVATVHLAVPQPDSKPQRVVAGAVSLPAGPLVPRTGLWLHAWRYVTPAQGRLHFPSS